MHTVVDYCPECDALIPIATRECRICNSRTVRLGYEVPENHWAAAMFFSALALTAAFMAFNVLGNIIHTGAVTIVIMISLMIWFFYFIYWENKPAQDAALARARQLHRANRERYDRGEIIEDDYFPEAAQFPWSIRNVDSLLIALIVSIIIMPAPLIYLFFFSTGEPMEMVAVALSSLVALTVPMVIRAVYVPARRLYEIIKALKLGPGDIWQSFNRLSVRGGGFGRFELFYDDSGYRVSVPLDQAISKGLKPQTVWSRPHWPFRTRSRERSPHQPMSDDRLEAVRSLGSIIVEEHDGKMHVSATIRYRPFYEESQDAELMLKMLAEVRSHLESQARATP